eukprot:gene7909-8726_t
MERALSLLFFLHCLLCLLPRPAASYRTSIFELAKEIHANYTHSNGSLHQQHHHVVKKVVILRVPKASSSSLSMVARHFMGCDPPGPCCIYPGDPPGSCPLEELGDCERNGKILGCTGHYPHHNEMIAQNHVFSMTALRDPRSRAISAYGYGGSSSIHYNGRCVGGLHDEKCIQSYLTSVKWMNVAVKMLSGQYAYAPVRTCESSISCPTSLEVANATLNRMGIVFITELWEVSMLALHALWPSLVPRKEEFLIDDGHGSLTLRNALRLSNHSSSPLREYKDQIDTAYQLDRQLYIEGVTRLCADLHRLDLWKYEVVRSYWHEKARVHPTACTKSSHPGANVTEHN